MYDIVEGTLTEIGITTYDVPSEAPVGVSKVITCLSILLRVERWGGSIGLVLVPAGKNGTSRRVGRCCIFKLEWYKGGAEGEIVIV